MFFNLKLQKQLAVCPVWLLNFQQTIYYSFASNLPGPETELKLEPESSCFQCN